MLKIGCCGFAASMKTYFSTFGLIEIQRTFYKLPRLTTAEGWREKAPDDFEFTLKAWQGITHKTTSPTYRRAKLNIPEQKKRRYGHFQPTGEVLEGWEKSREIAKALRARIMVLQCPPGFTETDQTVKNLETFLRRINRGGLKIALEFRGGWTAETIRRLGSEFNLIHCVDPFAEEALTGPIRYYRLHGSPPGEKMYRYQYRERDFEFLDNKIRKDLDSVSEVYCLFNNFSMKEDARAFTEFRKKRRGSTTVC